MGPKRAFVTFCSLLLVVLAGGTAAAAVCDGGGPEPGGQAQYSGSVRIPGLGALTVEHTWDRRTKVTLSAEAFVYTKVTTESGDGEITIAGAEGDGLAVRFGHGGVSVARGGRTIDAAAGSEALEAARALVGGRAVTSFRRRVGEYERRLAAERDGARRGDRLAPYAYSVLLAAAFVGELGGDPNALDRTREIIRRRLQPALRAAGLRREDCVAEYERALLQSDAQLTDCLNSAENHEWFYERAAQRLLCHAEFIARAESALGQFIQCSALRIA